MDLSNLSNINPEKSFSSERKRRLKGSPDVTAANNLTFARKPPQALELEEAVLGAIMLEKSAFDTASELINADVFYDHRHQRIYSAMMSLQQKRMPIDLLTVTEELRKREELDMVEGPYKIARLTSMVVSSAHIEDHCKILVQKYIQRQLIHISGEIITDAFEDSTDGFDLLDEAEGKLFEVSNAFQKRNFEEINSVLKETIDRIEVLRQRKEEISGVPSGFRDLDRITYGFQPTDLIILAARPSVGKTAFALNLARHAALHAQNPIPVGFFSLEMSNSQLVQRILSAESGVPMQKIARGHLEDHEMSELMKKGIEPLNSAPIYLDDTGALNIFELRAKARRMVNKYNVGLIIIDYLQLMSGSADKKNMNREQEISTISRSLKALAKELNIPIIALSQLSRALETRRDGNKVPQLSDLRESGAIEQDADMVMFIYRADYHEITQDENGESLKDVTTIKIAKHRNGELGLVNLKAQLHIQRFVDADSPGEHLQQLPPSKINKGETEAQFYTRMSKMGNQDFEDNSDYAGDDDYIKI